MTANSLQPMIRPGDTASINVFFILPGSTVVGPTTPWGKLN